MNKFIATAIASDHLSFKRHGISEKLAKNTELVKDLGIVVDGIKKTNWNSSRVGRRKPRCSYGWHHLLWPCDSWGIDSGTGGNIWSMAKDRVRGQDKLAGVLPRLEDGFSEEGNEEAQKPPEKWTTIDLLRKQNDRRSDGR